MKTNPISYVGALLLAFFSYAVHAQSIGTIASGVWISDCNQSDFFNTSGDAASFPGPIANDFNNSSLGVHTQNSGTLIFRGGQLKTFKDPATSTVCSARMFYRIYLQSAAPGAFSSIDLPLLESCDIPTSQYPSGGTCNPGDQKWQSPSTSINLTSRAPGNYFLEVYYTAAGSLTTTTLCNDVITLNDGGANYKAAFSIQATPTLTSTNPSTCNGTEGSITISGLTPGATYDLSYNDDATVVGPLSFTANGTGRISITGLNAGLYSNFSLVINGCTTNLFTGVILSNPIFIPTFAMIAPFCAGNTAPPLPLTSNNGVTGTWNPAVINNAASGTYTFTPAANQCGLPVSINVIVIPRTVPSFTFGTSLTICAGGTVPSLPNNSTNGVPGTWSPTTVSNQNSGVYTFTPNGGVCAAPATFTVTVNPNITPSFSFGTSLTMCANAPVPTLPTTSANGITGVWFPATVDPLNSQTYNFTPTAGQCATPTSFAVTVNPNVTPSFAFGSTLIICANTSIFALPTTSDNGVTGTWSPATINNQTGGNYVFTPTAGLCAVPFLFTVTVNPNITPTFSFGSSLTICAGGAFPSLPTTSTNGVLGTWVPSFVDDQNSGTYTFTPLPGLCALPTTFTVTVNPNIPPTFSFGTSQTICANGTAPILPATSNNGITGVWSPATVSNTTTGTYTFTPTAGLCALPATFTLTVNPNLTPTFSFGTSLTICAGGSVPTLPTTSINGITGTWSPAIVDNQNSGSYTFTPTAGACAVPSSFSVTVNPNIIPTFSFGTTLSICDGGVAPVLPTTSVNGITGTWNPSVADNHNSATYTFTPTAGLCALPTTFAITVNPNLTPNFAIGSSLIICAGGNVPTLPDTSPNGIAGSWSPSTVNNQTSGVYTFTPNPGQCVTPATITFTVTVTTNLIPTFSFGATLNICNGGVVPVLPTTSDNGLAGTWSPSVVSNTTTGTYVFTPAAGQCVLPFTYTVTINPILNPTFSFGTSQSVCIGSTVPVLPAVSTNGITGTWNPSTIDNMTDGTYTFTPAAGQCANPATFTLQVNPIPGGTIRSDTSVYDGATVPLFNFNVTNGGIVNWTNSNPAIGLPANGTGSVPSFTAINLGTTPITATITVTPNVNGCIGAAQTYIITVLPLSKDVFVPNVFTPNGDGKNDLLQVYGNYIISVDMRIFNQWGQQIASITNKAQGWDGRHKGSPQPVGVYVYVLRAQLADGRTVNLKGSITLIR